MLNGSGIGVTLFLSGCEHHCKGCHNPVTWDINDGLEFDTDAVQEILDELDNDWCDHITLSGGDPLHTLNRNEVAQFCEFIKTVRPNKKIWLYTGYYLEELNLKDYPMAKIFENIDFLVDGRFIQELADINYPFAGSTNQRIIDVNKSRKEGRVICWTQNGSKNSGTEENSSSPAPCCEGL